MHIQIIGMGMTGSAITNEVLNLCIADRITLVECDRKRLNGEWMDFDRVIKLKGMVTRINKARWPDSKADVSIITAGSRADYIAHSKKKEAWEELYMLNWPLVNSLVRELDGGRIIIVTNPAERIGKKLRSMYPSKRIQWAGNLIDRIQDGREITLLKGWTNWGIAAEVGLMLNGGGDTGTHKEVKANGHSKAEEGS